MYVIKNSLSTKFKEAFCIYTRGLETEPRAGSNTPRSLEWPVASSSWYHDGRPPNRPFLPTKPQLCLCLQAGLLQKTFFPRGRFHCSSKIRPQRHLVQGSANESGDSCDHHTTSTLCFYWPVPATTSKDVVVEAFSISPSHAGPRELSRPSHLRNYTMQIAVQSVKLPTAVDGYMVR